MKVILCFKEIKLGALSYEFGTYIYNSFLDGEKQFRDYLNSNTYELFNSINKHSRVLFEPFATIIHDIKKRSDLVELCSVESSDDFGVLCEYAKLNQVKFGYNLLLE